jgi:murein DD-endopeptidase MepM/ murein hydrolase activator NlpD
VEVLHRTTFLGPLSGELGQAARMRTRLLATLLLLAPVVLFAPPPAIADPAPTPVATPWVPPVEPQVTRPFEPLPHPYAAGHRGVDLRGSPGTPVRSAGDGVVVFAGMVAGRPVVSIDHANGLRTTYEPVDPSVAAGQRVPRGAVVGNLRPGHAGCPAAACLHWGLRRGESYLDPLNLLEPPRIRLLPLG